MSTRSGRTQYTEQEILNYGLDVEDIKPPTSIRGGLWYIDSNITWARVPFMELAPRYEADYLGNKMIYQGWNLRYNALTSEADWIIRKMIYSGNFLIKHQVKVGEYDERAGTMSWDI